MKQEEILKLFNEVGAIIINSHIIYTSWRHGSVYVNKDAIYPHTAYTSCLCEEIAEKFSDYSIDVVIAPAIGGVILSRDTAQSLSEIHGKEIFGVYAEKGDNDTFIIKRGYDKFITDKNVLIVEDILTTGGTVKKVVEAVRSIGGNVVAVAALCNRGNITTSDLGDVPELFALVNITLDSWEEKDCPLCAQGIPINIDVGKGREFLKKRGLL